MAIDRREVVEESAELEERVVQIIRTAKVVKGGRRFSFRALVVVGDKQGRVGVGIGKANEVPDAIRKGITRAKRNMIRVPIVGTTIPHPITIKFGAAKLMLKPASPGTGVIAAGGVRAVMEAAGIRDILTKSLGSNNVLNVTQAAFEALKQLQDPEETARLRGLPLERIQPFWLRKKRKKHEQESTNA